MTQVKICGITNLEDALVAARAGADMLGFIFYPPSPRAADPAVVREIVSQLRQEAHCPVLIGVFVNETAAEIARVLDSCGLDMAQLSGDETPSLIGDPQSPIFGRSFKSLKPTSFAEAEADAEWFLPPAALNTRPALLLDAYHPTLPGGTGQVIDWTMAALLAAKVPGLMLAGGLTPENVVAAVRQVRPYAVDVAGGVEAGPGRKDHQKVETFIRLVHELGEA